MDKSVVVSRKHAAEKQALAVQMRREMTPAEKLLWERPRGNRLGGLKFRRQQIIEGFVVDFYCHVARLAVEADGDVHGTQVEYDQERDEIIATHELCILRFSNQQILNDTEAVLMRIVTTAQQRLSCPPLEEGLGQVS